MKHPILLFGLLVMLLSPALRSQTDSLQGLNLRCGINLPMDPWDSVKYPLWYLAHIAQYAVLSPDGRYLAFWYQDDLAQLFEGVGIFDIQRHALVKALPGPGRPQWHPSTHKVLTPFVVYDLESGIVTDLPVKWWACRTGRPMADISTIPALTQYLGEAPPMEKISSGFRLRNCIRISGR